jgi:hypothetical protein
MTEFILVVAIPLVYRGAQHPEQGRNGLHFLDMGDEDQFVADRLPQNGSARFIDGRQRVEGREDKAGKRGVETSCDLEPTAVPLTELLFQSRGVDNVDA